MIPGVSGSASATTPPTGVDGLEPGWSRLVPVPATGATWHLLDNGVANARITLLCVHGNPSWSYLFRRIVAATAGSDVRVIAVDQLGMGYSERTLDVRRLATRIDDLCLLTDEIGLDGPIVTVGHDWGGPISLGWALRHRTEMRGVVLLNTAVHQPAGSPAPMAIRLARTRGVLGTITIDSAAFVRGAIGMSRPPLSKSIQQGFLAPYGSPDRRRAIREFVEDIPLDPDHPSAATLDAVAAGLGTLGDVPALLLWGSRDLVFSDLYLHDLERRLPHASVHRFPTAGHFVSEDVDTTSVILDWVASRATQSSDDPRPHTEPVTRPLWTGFSDHPDPATLAVVELDGSTGRRSITFSALAGRVAHAASGLLDAGVRPGDRVGILVPPGIDLSVALNACWRLGAIAVLIDAGLGVGGMRAALASAAPDHVIGVPKALAAARALRFPGTPISTVPLGRGGATLLGVEHDLRSLEQHAAPVSAAHAPDDDIAAIAFTSGATGPSKGVRYRHRQLCAQRDALVRLYDITTDDRLVAAFAPFALYGPIVGITSVVPDMDITAPASLTAVALADAIDAVDATMVFASPAALANVVDTLGDVQPGREASFARVRLVMSAGAPVHPQLLQQVASVCPHAEIRTPYGMTEALPIADIALPEILEAGDADGVCVGRPIDGVDVVIHPIDASGVVSPDATSDRHVLGEIVVRAPHARDGYDRLWHIEHLASQPSGWHRTGDVGLVDAQGRLWVSGRIGHVITAAGQALAPVPIEHAVAAATGCRRVAAVGVGPVGRQQIVVVLEDAAGRRRPHLADLEQHDAVRSCVEHPVAAVFEIGKLPVDRRHNSKIDRSLVASWAERTLTGARVGAM